MIQGVGRSSIGMYSKSRDARPYRLLVNPSLFLFGIDMIEIILISDGRRFSLKLV